MNMLTIQVRHDVTLTYSIYIYIRYTLSKYPIWRKEATGEAVALTLLHSVKFFRHCSSFAVAVVRVHSPEVNLVQPVPFSNEHYVCVDVRNRENMLLPQTGR